MSQKIKNIKYFYNIISSIKIASVGAGLYPTDFEGYLTGNKKTGEK